MSTKVFAGLPVTGDFTSGYRNDAVQISAEEFGSLLLAALSAEGVLGLRWSQYTPYFNDGEPCTFRTYFGDVQLAGFDTNDDEYESEVDEEEGAGWTSLYSVRFVGGEEEINSHYVRDAVGYGGHYESDKTGVVFPPHPSMAAVKALEQAIDNGSAEAVLLDSFGDHAKVRVTRKGITVDYYEHD